MAISHVFHDAAATIRRFWAWVRYAGTDEYEIDKLTDELERYFAGERPAMPRYRYRSRSERDDELILQNVQLTKPCPAPVAASVQLRRSDGA